MEFRDKQTLFTPSEAHWAQDATRHMNMMPGLSQKILDARIAFAIRSLPAYKVPEVSIKAASGDIVAGVRLGMVLEHLHETALEHGVDDQQERHVIAVLMSQEEKQELLLLAQIDNQTARERLEAPEICAFGQEMINNDFAMFVATSDVMEPDQAVALGDLLRDPELKAEEERQAREEAEQTVAATASIITALEVGLTA